MKHMLTLLGESLFSGSGFMIYTFFSIHLIRKFCRDFSFQETENGCFSINPPTLILLEIPYDINDKVGCVDRMIGSTS